MLRAAEPDLSLVTTLLQAVRADYAADRLWQRLTNSVIDDTDTALALHRLRQINAAHPLRQINLHLASPQLLPALGAATTLESVWIASELPDDFKSQIAVQLKAVPSLREISLNEFPIDVGLELLQSRNDWEQICLPEQKADRMKASALAAHNKTAFKIEAVSSEACEGIALWLTNPHLTALWMAGAIPVNVWYELEKLRYCVAPQRTHHLSAVPFSSHDQYLRHKQS